MKAKKKKSRLDGRKTGRDKKTGRFQKGNPGGPGRLSRAAEREYLEVLKEACPLSEWRRICRKATADAVRGNRWAREWLSRHLLPNFELLVGQMDSKEETWHFQVALPDGRVLSIPDSADVLAVMNGPQEMQDQYLVAKDVMR